VTDTLLPDNATNFERSMEGAMSRISDVPVPVREVWSVPNCPSDLLPWLASALQVGQWDATWSDDVKRAVIANSASQHRRRGTVSSIRDFFASIGFGNIDIDEGRSNRFYNGALNYDGFETYGDPAGWAYYRVRFHKLLSNAQAAQARAILAVIAPVRCHLWSLDFTGAALTYNAVANFDGSYSYGVA
jgi:phage tail P2-like protein